MLEEFRSPRANRRANARFGGALTLALVIFVSLGATLVAASSTIRTVLKEELTQVEFVAPPPKPEPPPTPPAPLPPVLEPQPTPQVSSPRPKVKRPELKPPTEISKEKPPESDQPLSAAGEPGPVDGFLTGVEGGRGTAATPPPPPPPARVAPPPPPLEPPVALRGNEAPRYSVSARLSRVEGTIVVTYDVLEDGRVGNVQIVSGPKELHDTVLKAIAAWRFQPARRGSAPMRFRKTQSIVFRLEAG